MIGKNNKVVISYVVDVIYSFIEDFKYLLMKSYYI